MQPAVFFFDRMGLVTRIDDAALIRCGTGNLLPDMLGALRDVKHRASAGAKHLAGPGKDLAGHQERDQLLRHIVEIRGAIGEIIFVAAVGIADEVRVVFEDRQIPVKTLLAHFTLGIVEQVFQNPFARLVVDRHVQRTGTFRRGIFRMAAGIEIKPGAVFQENV